MINKSNMKSQLNIGVIKLEVFKTLELVAPGLYADVYKSDKIIKVSMVYFKNYFAQMVRFQSTAPYLLQCHNQDMKWP